MTYWELRAKRLIEQAERTAEEVERALLEAYEEALVTVQKELSYLYTRYLSAVDKKMYYSVVEGVRLMQLEKEIAGVLESLGDKTVALLQGGLIEVFTEAYASSFKDLSAIPGFGLSFSAIPNTAVRLMLLNPWSGLNFSERVWKDVNLLASRVQEIIVQGLIRGSSIRQMALEVTTIMDTSYSNAKRLVRTEVNYAANQGILKGIKDAGLTKYEYSAVLDNRTSAVCEELDGQVFNVDEAVAGVTLPPMHPNCRSTILGYFGD